MSAHSDAVAAGASAALLAAIGIYAASARAASRIAGEIERELCLSISDGFTRQTWRRGEQSWTETRDTLSMHEDECVRVTILNDTPALRVVSFGDGRMLRIPAGEIMSMIVAIDSPAPFSISVVGQPAMSRPVRVRALQASGANVI